MKKVTITLGFLLIGLMSNGISYAKSPLQKISTAKFVTPNQTDALSPVQSQSSLPFRIIIEKANFLLPVGFHSGVVGVYKGLWIFIGGRINGLHGFGITNNFPTDSQNTSIYVVNPDTGVTSSRSLSDPSSGLTQKQIDSLTVTSPQAYQEGNTLYMTGGYGVDSATNTFGTKPVLTAINLAGIVQWVTKPQNKDNNVANNIRQLYNPTFQIAGGEMARLGSVTQLVFGQNFDGQYTTSSNGNYSNQVRQFKITNTNGQFAVDIYQSVPNIPNPNYRRRDLNVIPSLLNVNNNLQYALIAYSGVFTLASGVWTVPVIINGTSDPVMPDPNSPSTFKQAMNQYVSARVGLYSRKSSSMYHLLFGGISYGYYDHGVFTTDTEIPFLNQVTAIQIDKNNNFTQYLMDGEYPVIPSTGPNPGNPLLFGAGAYFMANNLPKYPNNVLNLDSIRKSTVIGYIVGGIASTLQNTNTSADSFASPYVFKVTLVPNPTLETVRQSSESLSLSHVTQPSQQNLVHVAHLEQKYNHKYRESSYQLIQQSHHPV